MGFRPRRGRLAALVSWQGRVSAVSHTRPNHSPVSLQRPVRWGPPTVPRSRSFFLVSKSGSRPSWSRCCCCCCLLLVLPTTSVLKRCFYVISPRLSVVSSRGLRAAIALSREGLPRVRIRPRRGRRAALARWQGRVSAVSHTRPNHNALELFFSDFFAAKPRFLARLARSDSPQSRGPCPRADPPSPRPSRSASDVARSRLRGLPLAPYVFV